MDLRKIKIFIAAAVIAAALPTAYAAQVEVSGDCVGVKLYTDGLMVCDTAPLVEKDGTRRNIAEEYNIEKGDMITRVNGQKPGSNEDMISALCSSGSNITLTVRRNGKERDVKVTPADTVNGAKLGLWLRDSTAGFGTITFFSGENFAALGHGIYDVDTGDIMPVGKGIIQQSRILSVTRSKNGMPGAISGEINGEVIGSIEKNCDHGLFGTAPGRSAKNLTETATKEEVQRGPATILANVDGNGVKEYSIEIKRIYAASDGRDMVIKVTDDALIETTGGIVQGMSGAPIMQNGKLVGALTHVFVNDPTKGYGIFIDNMLNEL